jgi:hypothetical protein
MVAPTIAEIVEALDAVFSTAGNQDRWICDDELTRYVDYE